MHASDWKCWPAVLSLPAFVTPELPELTELDLCRGRTQFAMLGSHLGNDQRQMLEMLTTMLLYLTQNAPEVLC